MPPSSILQQRVRARKDLSEDEAISPSEVSSEHSNAPDTDNSISEDDSSDHHNSDTLSPSSPPASDPSTLSFGALARAQEALSKPSHPRDTQPPHHPRPRPRPLEASRSHRPRPSKHAPQSLSSKHAVSRHRTIIPSPLPPPRDPRFDPLTGPLDPNRFTQNYSFLTSYRASEISALKSAIRGPKTSAEEKEKLQTALKRMESRKQAEEGKERERKVVREHRKGEREKVKEGKKPFFLKEGEVRRRVLVGRFEGMGERRRERVVERRRKKMAGREKKLMPVRRGVEG